MTLNVLDRSSDYDSGKVPPGVLVLGMGRSGTSALTPMITVLALSLCVEEDRVPPPHFNRLGFFESRTIQMFNRLMLMRWSLEGGRVWPRTSSPPRGSPAR